MTACSDSTDPASGAGAGSRTPGANVASLPSAPGAAPRPSAAAAATDGPLIRADTSKEEYARFYRPYRNCLKDQGVPFDWPEKPGADSYVHLEPDQIIEYRTQLTACQSLQPETVHDRFERKNPEAFQAALHDFIDCMNSHDQDVIFIAPDAWGVSDEDAGSMNLSDDVIDDCETEAYGG